MSFFPICPIRLLLFVVCRIWYWLSLLWLFSHTLSCEALCANLVHTFVEDLVILFNVELEGVLQELSHTSNGRHVIFVSGGREDVVNHFAFGLTSRMSLPLPLNVQTVNKADTCETLKVCEIWHMCESHKNWDGLYLLNQIQNFECRLAYIWKLFLQLQQENHIQKEVFRSAQHRRSSSKLSLWRPNHHLCTRFEAFRSAWMSSETCVRRPENVNTRHLLVLNEEDNEYLESAALFVSMFALNSTSHTMCSRILWSNSFATRTMRTSSYNRSGITEAPFFSKRTLKFAVVMPTSSSYHSVIYSSQLFILGTGLSSSLSLSSSSSLSFHCASKVIRLCRPQRAGRIRLHLVTNASARSNRLCRSFWGGSQTSNQCKSCRKTWAKCATSDAPEILWLIRRDGK